jgi:hypothetical protein
MAHPDPKSRGSDILAALLGLLGAGLLLSTRWEVDVSGPYPFYKGPLIFPLIVLSLMVLAGLPALWRLIQAVAGASWSVAGLGMPSRPLVLLALMVLFTFGIGAVGLEVSSFLFMSIAFYYLGYRDVTRLILIPLIGTVALVVVFKYFLGVYFPSPFVFGWFRPNIP